MTRPSKQQLHPDLDNFRTPGGMFDVEPSELDLSIGKTAVYKCEDDSIPPGKQLPGTIIAIQKNYAGKPCYRVVTPSDKHKFGFLVNPEEINCI